MKRSSVTLCAGLLFTAAAVKLAFPGQSKKAIDTLVVPSAPPSVSLNTQTAPAAEPVTVTINAADYLKKDANLVEADLPAAVEEAVETFLSDQEPFSSMAIPADATYDVVLPEFRYMRPVSARTSSAFGFRVHPLENLTKFHYGTDLAAISGDDIVSFADGTVTEVGQDDTLGHFLRIEHEDGYESLYAHCGTIFARQGQRVSAGEKIALVGISGRVTGPHLHFELTKDGVHMNPEFFFAAI